MVQTDPKDMPESPEPVFTGVVMSDTRGKRPTDPEDWYRVDTNTGKATKIIERRKSLGEIINGTKKFLLAIATLAAVVLIVVLTQDTNPELAEQAITVGLPSAGTIGLSQFVHDLVKTRKKAE